jgi:hypothetical protein
MRTGQSVHDRLRRSDGGFGGTAERSDAEGGRSTPTMRAPTEKKQETSMKAATIGAAIMACGAAKMPRVSRGSVLDVIVEEVNAA